MITTNDCAADANALEIKRSGYHVGYILWHAHREPNICLTKPYAYLTIAEIDQVLNAYYAKRRLPREQGTSRTA